ncbi:MAG: trypsin-like peptidase domain-containing protein [Chitinophagaceae bacterium]|jgi:S1-C subfamily serine protease|nr:trypsin-like peptidase domain-containing protein [Chitinophagaceae bacterium]OQY93072.1 MAG: peptidase S1 [Sphingobacteriales bacterium UTBCD1]
MDDIQILDAVERYIRGEMNPDERLHFENLRKSSPEVDQMVVEHTLFLQQINKFAEWKKFRDALHNTHINLSEQGKIDSAKLKGKAKVVYLWNRYKRVAAIAAVIAGVTTLIFTSLVNYLTPHTDSAKVQELSRDIPNIKHQQNVQVDEVNNLKNEVNNIKSKINLQSIPFKAGGTGFLIDGKGFLVTNAHIVHTSRNIAVTNSKGEQFRAVLVKEFPDKDIAILKIDDDKFKPLSSIPYGISKTESDVAEPIYTLGYPRNDIVYSEGYLSAKTGFNGDTLSCQLGIAANPGNSGGPVFNHEGEVIGILSTKETEAEGVAFAIQSKYIYSAINELKKSNYKDTAYQSLRIPVKSSVRNMDTKEQVKKIQDYVFFVKGD